MGASRREGNCYVWVLICRAHRKSGIAAKFSGPVCWSTNHLCVQFNGKEMLSEFWCIYSSRSIQKIRLDAGSDEPLLYRVIATRLPFLYGAQARTCSIPSSLLSGNCTAAVDRRFHASQLRVVVACRAAGRGPSASLHRCSRPDHLSRSLSHG